MYGVVYIVAQILVAQSVVLRLCYLFEAGWVHRTWASTLTY